MDLIKLKSFCIPKENVEKNENTTYWIGEILINVMTKKGLISKYSKNSYNLASKTLDNAIKNKKKTWFLKLAQELNRYFSKRKCRQPTDTWKDAQYH